MATAHTPQLHHHRSLLVSVDSETPPAAGPTAAEISTAVVGLLRSHTGRGPTKARTILDPDLVVVTLDDCLTRVELTLMEHGGQDLVKAVRSTLHEAVRPQAEAVVSAITGRPVVASCAYTGLEPEHAVIAFNLG